MAFRHVLPPDLQEKKSPTTNESITIVKQFMQLLWAGEIPDDPRLKEWSLFSKLNRDYWLALDRKQPLFPLPLNNKKTEAKYGFDLTIRWVGVAYESIRKSRPEEVSEVMKDDVSMRLLFQLAHSLLSLINAFASISLFKGLLVDLLNAATATTDVDKCNNQFVRTCTGWARCLERTGEARAVMDISNIVTSLYPTSSRYEASCRRQRFTSLSPFSPTLPVLNTQSAWQTSVPGTQSEWDTQVPTGPELHKTNRDDYRRIIPLAQFDYFVDMCAASVPPEIRERDLRFLDELRKGDIMSEKKMKAGNRSEWLLEGPDSHLRESILFAEERTADLEHFYLGSPERDLNMQGLQLGAGARLPSNKFKWILLILEEMMTLIRRHTYGSEFGFALPVYLKRETAEDNAQLCYLVNCVRQLKNDLKQRMMEFSENIGFAEMVCQGSCLSPIVFSFYEKRHRLVNDLASNLSYCRKYITRLDTEIPSTVKMLFKELEVKELVEEDCRRMASQHIPFAGWQ